MDHIILSDGWEYAIEPFPCYKLKTYPPTSSVETELIMIEDVITEVYYEVIKNDSTRLYYGTDESAARDAKRLHDQGIIYDFKKSIIRTTIPILRKNEFEVRVIRGSNKLYIKHARDITNGCLLFVGCFGSIGSLNRGKTTANIMKVYSRKELFNPNSVEIIASLKKGQSVVIDIIGRDSRCFRYLTWNGNEIVQDYRRE